MQDNRKPDIRSIDQVTACFIGDHHSGKSVMAGSLLATCDGPSHVCPRRQQKFQQEYEMIIGPTTELNEWLSRVSDTTKCERERRRTLNVKFNYLQGNSYALNILDTPSGEYEYHVAKAVAYSDYAVLVIPADTAVDKKWGQAFIHARIAYGLGIRSLVVAISKMDLVFFSHATYDEICTAVRAILKVIGFKASSITCLPFSSAYYRPEDLKTSPLKWYTGSSLAETLMSLKVPLRQFDVLFRMMIFDIYKIYGVGYVVMGRVISGSVVAGALIWPHEYESSGESKSIESAHTNRAFVAAGDVAAINIRGMRKPHRNNALKMISLDSHDKIRAASELLVFIDVVSCPFNLHAGSSCRLDGNGQSAGCRIKQIVNQIDKASAKVLAVDPPRLQASRTYTVVLSMLRRVYVDTYRDYGRQGMFVLMESNVLIGYGMVKEITKYHDD